MAHIVDVPLVKKTSSMLNEFVNKKDGKSYSFDFLPDLEDSNPASRDTFKDEEIVREQYWYPFIEENDIIFDIGASFGSYTLPALAMGAIVYAFSPEHEFKLIKKNISENGGFGQRSHVYDFGFYSKSGRFKTDRAWFYEDDEVSKHQLEETNHEHWIGWFIPVKRLDDFVNTLNLDKINYIKIDTEGAEFEILKGGEQTIKKYKPKLLVEFHLFKDHDVARKCNEFLINIGYEQRGFVEYNKGLVHHGFFTFPSTT